MKREYYLEDVSFAPEDMEEIQSMILEAGLGVLLTLSGDDDEVWMQQDLGPFVQGRDIDAIEKILDRIAVLVKGTTFDCQVINFEIDGTRGMYLLAGGKRTDLFGEKIEITMPAQLVIGEECDVPATLRVVGLRDKKALLLEVR